MRLKKLCAIAAFAVSGCSGDTDAPVSLELVLENIAPSAGVMGAMGTYLPALSPGLALVSPDESSIFTPGSMVGDGVERLAEEGDPLVLAGQLSGSIIVSKGYDTTYQTAPLLPGEQVSFVFEAVRGDRLHLVMMYGESNDVLVATAAAGVVLFADESPALGDVPLHYWDAGTEINEPPSFGESQPPRMAESGEEEAGVISLLEDDTDAAGFTYPPVATLVRATVRGL